MANNSRGEVLVTNFDKEFCYSVKDVADITLEALQEKLKGEITVIGEVVNFRSANYRGFIYFTLLDEAVQIDKYKLDVAIFDRSMVVCNLQGGLSGMQDGLKVKVTGKVGVYASKYQLTNITKITYADEGDKQRLLELLRKELEEKGYFAKENKKHIPLLLKRVALLTASQGEARHDFIKALGNHTKRFMIDLINIPVQNVSNAKSVAGAIMEANKKNIYDIIFLIRGGGASEDFDLFNTREVLDAIFSSSVPIITAIGHEQDHCLTDDVADLFLATPTYAGKYIADNYNNIFTFLSHSTQVLDRVRVEISLLPKNRLLSYSERLMPYSPEKYFQQIKERFYNLENKLSIAFQNIRFFIGEKKRHLSELDLRLQNGANISKQEYFLALKKRLEISENKFSLSYKNSLFAYFSNQYNKLRMIFIHLETFKKNKKKDIEDSRLKLLDIERRLRTSITQIIYDRSRAMAGVERALSHLNPEKVLERGYAIISKGNSVVSEAKSLNNADKVMIKLFDGIAEATIDRVAINTTKEEES